MFHMVKITWSMYEQYTSVSKYIYYTIYLIHYIQHIYTYDMRSNIYNIQTYYRTRLFGNRIIMRRKKQSIEHMSIVYTCDTYFVIHWYM